MTHPDATGPAPRRVLFAHAHPDDETIATGALIAHLTRHGIACDVVTMTRGEMGEVVPGPLSHLMGTDALVSHREGELAGALQALGVDRHAFLGTPPARAGESTRTYRDSGMRWVREGLAGPADDSDERSFTAAPLEDVVADLAAVIDAWSPDLVVSYDANGGYGHPDHVRTHEVAQAAAAGAGVGFAEVRHEREDGVVWFDLSALLPVVQDALRHHASQLTVHGSDLVHSGGQREAIVVQVGLWAAPDSVATQQIRALPVAPAL